MESRPSSSLLSAPLLSAFRAVCLVGLTVFSLCKIPSWIHTSLRVSPVLSILLVLSVMYILGRLWKKYSRDVSVTVFRAVLNTVYFLNEFRREHNYQQNRRERGLIHGKFVRIVVFFLLVQHCIVPHVNFLWLYTLLSFTFLTDLSHEISLVGGIVSDQQNRTIVIFINVLKAVFCTVFFIYTSIYISLVYILISGAYFLLGSDRLENVIVKQMESFQFEFFEGLEQFYVNVLLNCIRIVLALVFMLWNLIHETQLLMLVALYTNIYQGSKEIINNTMSEAFVEWSSLTQFPRASKNELFGHDDVCAICLCSMKSARKTPCKHLFHGRCLRKCLKEKMSCPMCNSNFVKLN